MANVYSIGRHAQCEVSVANVATTSPSGVFFPAGAIITGMRVMAPDAITITGASATVRPYVGAVAIAAVSTISNMTYQTTPVPVALGTTNGIYLGTSGEFGLVCQASNNSAATGTYQFYVDYIVPV